MRHWPATAVLMLMLSVVLAVPAQPQQKPFTQEQVQGMVGDGFGDESGAKLIEQHGIDFEPTEDFLESLKAAGANDAFLRTLRTAGRVQPPAEGAKKPLNQLRIFALLAGQVPTHRVTMLVQERGIDFEPKDEYLQQIRIIGGDDELINAVKNAKVMKSPSVELELQAQYLRDEMWDEAVASLKEAVSKQQFDPVLRMALGEALFRTGDYEQAIRELETAKKLDGNLWQATRRMADVHLKIWEVRKSLPDRVLACDLYQELLSSQAPNGPNSERLAALFPDWNDETSEKSEAQSKLAELESPAGVWENQRGDLYFFRSESTGWDLQSDTRTAGQYSFSIVGTTPLTGLTLSGTAAQITGKCIVGGAAEIAVSAHGTQLDVTYAAEQGRALEGGITQERACAWLIRFLQEGRRKTGELGDFELHLVRKDDAQQTKPGVALENKADADEKIAEYRAALRLSPNSDVAHYNLGVALGNNAEWDGAIAEYREALRLNPNNGMAHVKLGVALGTKHDYDGSIAEYREALRLRPSDDMAHVGLGTALGGKGDWDGMVAECREALSLNPNNDTAHFGLGVALGEKRDRGGAIAEYHEALRLNQNNGTAHYYLGLALEKKRDRQGALEEFRAAYMLDPKDATFKQDYERLLHRMNK